MSDPEIEEAIERVRNGNTDDFRIVVAAYHQRLRASLAGLCPPSVDSEEIAHLSFVEAYRNLGRYQAGTNFFAWLCAIARNRLLAECKRIQRQASHQRNYLEQLLVERVVELAEAEPELTDARLGWLRQCVTELKPSFQAILERRYGRGETIEGIARAVGRTAGALRVQLFAIRKQLRRCIEGKRRETVNPGAA
jgi:RNA polymerase sigma-70 factor (ECF subfamily)